LGKELEKRLLKLEQALPGVSATAPYWEDFDWRCRIADLYGAWWFEGGERPDLSHPRDRYWWTYMEQIREVIDEMAAEGNLDSYASERTVP
jgi:hypothetical protein